MGGVSLVGVSLAGGGGLPGRGVSLAGGSPWWGISLAGGGGLPGRQVSLEGVSLAGGSPWGVTLADPPVNRMTDACENITLPQMSFAGGNNQNIFPQVFCTPHSINKLRPATIINECQEKLLMYAENKCECSEQNE